MIRVFTLYRSTNPNKKYDIYIPINGEVRKISFGDSRYEDYTIHKDIKRRDNYRARHRNDNINDPLSAGFWSWHILWGDTTSLDKNLKNTITKYRLI